MTGVQNHAEPRIALRGVTKRFGDFTAVAPLDLEVRQGECVALLGPAGSGKTTVLRLIAGLESPTSGTIHIGGLEVTPMPAQRRDVAFTFASPALYPHLSVERNLAYPMRAQRIPRNAIERRVGAVIDRLQLEKVRRHKPRRLSGSERQLVNLGRAMVRDAKAFCFDEPLAPFDDHGQRDAMRRDVRAIHEELRATTVLATRDPLDAVVTADRIVVMNGGRVVQADTPQVVYDRPADLFVARFLGAHAMNFLDVAYADGAARLACCALSIPIDDQGARPVDPARVTLGIRPEYVRFDPRGVPAVATRTETVDADGTATVRFGEVTVRAAVPAERLFVEGEPVSIRFDAAGCRWFDATSGKALPWTTRTEPA